ncbi:hypothetical protein [Sphingomonas sp. SRS2]|uniref:hypothetical protein n=1 Tax=Sphingomonas sp. SRS2 TaxID=133190 RepID=UPI0006184675|nr:hypothetical protein [Sphingomonas sp. SRS2]KKC25806.1 hypothetical protein WP12_12175 [Sphingomonas sp. SRS2]
MTHRNNSGERKPVVFSASTVLEELAEALRAIKKADGLTDLDLAAVLGRSEDQALKYRNADAEMGVIAFARARREWNGRFTGGLDRLIAETRPVADADRAHGSKVLKAALALSIALEDNNQIDAHEIRANRCALEQARDALDELLRRPRAA